MKSFKIHRPASIDEATGLLPARRGPAEIDEARPLAGGQDLLTEMKSYLVSPESVVDLAQVEGLDEYDVGATLKLGAMTTLSRIAADAGIRSGWQALAEAAESVASPQIRSQATIGGNLCQRPRCWYYRHEEAHCIKKGGSECFAESGLSKYNAILGGGPSYIVHPSDCATALVCLDSQVTHSGSRGARTLPLEEFFTLPSEGSVMRENVLKANELLLDIEVPALAAGWKSTYLKFKERNSYDFALAAVAASGKLDGKKIVEVRLVLGGVAPIPWRATEAEEFLKGADNSEANWTKAAELALAEAEPLADNAYKIPLTQGLIQKALRALTTGGAK